MRNRFDILHVGTGKTQMKWFRSLLAGSLAFTAACASGPQTKTSVLPEKPAPSAASAQKPEQGTPVAQPAPQAPAPKEGTATELFTAALQAYEAGDLDSARHGFEKALAKDPRSLNAQFNLGVIAERQGRNDDARVAYEKVLLLEPGHVPSAVNLAALHRKQGHTDEAIALLEKALKQPGREHDASLLNSLSVTYRVAGKLNESESAARRVLVRSKDNPEAYKNLAQVAYARGQFRLAELLTGTALKHAEKDASLYNLLGMVYLKLDDRTRALAQFQKAVSLDDRFAPGYLNLGAMALSYRDYVGAERSFTKATELEPDSTEARLYLAWALDGQKGRDPKKGLAAGEAFEKVLAARADLQEAVCGAGWAYAADRAGWEKAIAFLDRCKGLQGTTEQDKQMLTAKVQGLQNMLKAPPPAQAAEGAGEKKNEATGGAGSVLNQLPQEQGEAPAEGEPSADGSAAASDAASPSGDTAEEGTNAAASGTQSPASAAPAAPAQNGAATGSPAKDAAQGVKAPAPGGAPAPSQVQ
ncbi:tetratricopeptide repeat protein [Pyxidicoccus parkwayensis]|uniref:Tetratricopeptide repeat protein n=1 Tax=Pyxidicoccus parkwayensis TaxID=2813578 RepID=A0ABX7PCG5_9BACT|nr:tetratricopeptide repeat protein [Pyxidicoccus parkwaysis]QSQ28165.1 tetratricopeptide repeat protein [Pyxidicoccus parkwaysis]